MNLLRAKRNRLIIDWDLKASVYSLTASNVIVCQAVVSPPPMQLPTLRYGTGCRTPFSL